MLGEKLQVVTWFRSTSVPTRMYIFSQPHHSSSICLRPTTRSTHQWYSQVSVCAYICCYCFRLNQVPKRYHCTAQWLSIEYILCKYTRSDTPCLMYITLLYMLPYHNELIFSSYTLLDVVMLHGVANWRSASIASSEMLLVQARTRDRSSWLTTDDHLKITVNPTLLLLSSYVAPGVHVHMRPAHRPS